MADKHYKRIVANKEIADPSMERETCTHELKGKMKMLQIEETNLYCEICYEKELKKKKQRLQTEITNLKAGVAKLRREEEKLDAEAEEVEKKFQAATQALEQKDQVIEELKKQFKQLRDYVSKRPLSDLEKKLFFPA